MNLLFRLLLIAIKSYFKKPVGLMGPILSEFRVWPSDLDMFGHMTNSRYFALMDAARTDLIMRTGLVSELKSRGWFPVVVEESMHFRRALLPFVKFQVKTEVTGYNDRHIIIRQTFLKKRKVVAVGIVRVRFLGPNKTRVETADLLNLQGVSHPFEPAISELEEAKYDHHKRVIEEENALL